MSNKKRNVTFDPELLPSSEATPPVLPLAHFPPIISKDNFENVHDPTIYKSILKNPPVGDKAYDSLCNFLIDIPPPPEEGLLSLDILQTETVFKPKNRFDDLKSISTKSAIQEEDSSDSEEDSEEDSDDDSVVEYNISEETNLQHTINDDDLLFDQSITKPKNFEAALILEHSSKERLEFTDFKEHINDSSLPEITSENKTSWITDTNVDISFSPINNDIEFTEIVQVKESKLETPVVEELFKTESTTLVSEEPQPGSPIEFETINPSIVWPVVDAVEDLDRRKIEEDILQIDIPSNEVDKFEYINPNIRKLDEEHNDLLEDFEIVNKRNKILDDSISSETNDYINLPTRQNIENLSSPLLDEEPIEESLQSPPISLPITDIIETSAISLSKDLHVEVIDHDTDKINSPSSPIEVDPILPLLQNTVIDHLESNNSESIPQDKPQVALPDTQINTEPIITETNTPPAITTQTNTPVPITTQTNSITSVVETAANPTTNNSDEVPNAINRHRRKSGSRKTHRKHSHASRSAATATEQKENITNTNVPIVTADQKSLDAQARFKRYLGKMSAKAMNENQNLNCAGEPETLEPHMRDSIKESQILIWIYNMIDEAARVDFEFFLKDGCIMCKLMNRIVPDCIPESEITWEGARSKQKNVNNFLREAEKYGVPKAKLFFSEDLLHLRHVPRVTRCIYALAKIAQTDAALGGELPQLGDEPSFLKEATKAVVVPGHRDTKDVLAQLTAAKAEDTAKKTKHSLYK